jgi:hypothetical protein
LGRWISAFVFALAMFIPTGAHASTMITFDTCFDGTLSCADRQPGITGRIDFGILNDGTLSMWVQGVYPGDNAFGFNLAGPTDGLTVSIWTGATCFPGCPEDVYFLDTDQIIGPLGSFEFVLDGLPETKFLPQIFNVRITRNAGFLSDLDVFEMNELGFLVGGRRVNFFGNSVFEAGSNLADIPQVPEPASMLLVGTGLVAAWRVRWRQS